MKFTHSSGQRPLEGFTLKRGIGRGGFGEVYYAVSDGGKEVALKLVRGTGDSAIELRGVSHCLNLKHPNLVALYDLRKDAEGNPWVVMEYIAGEPLNTVLARHPQGLPRELAREWFIGLARAIGHLHDHGIVHRDLKPANVFLENGMVKVGDYGLSKSISTSQRSAQTMSVGTVHYMAPEISTGNYNKQIDTYAAGIILYEMLTGRVPFDGESAGEILMKHLTAPPDLSRLPAEFTPLVAKALAKNPAQRFGSMAEMVRAVEATANRSAPRPLPPPQPVSRLYNSPAKTTAGDTVLHALPAETPKSKAAELIGSMLLTVLFAALGSTVWAALGHVEKNEQLYTLFFLTVAASWSVLVPAKMWAPRIRNTWSRRIIMLVLGSGIGLLAWWLDGGSLEHPLSSTVQASYRSSTSGGLIRSNLIAEAGYLSYFALGFFGLRWWRLADKRRSARFSFAPVLGAACLGFLLLMIINPGPLKSTYGTSLLVLVLASVVVQLVSPWEPSPPPLARKMRLRCA